VEVELEVHLPREEDLDAFRDSEFPDDAHDEVELPAAAEVLEIDAGGPAVGHVHDLVGLRPVVPAGPSVVDMDPTLRGIDQGDVEDAVAVEVRDARGDVELEESVSAMALLVYREVPAVAGEERAVLLLAADADRLFLVVGDVQAAG